MSAEFDFRLVEDAFRLVCIDFVSRERFEYLVQVLEMFLIGTRIDGNIVEVDNDEFC